MNFNILSESNHPDLWDVREQVKLGLKYAGYGRYKDRKGNLFIKNEKYRRFDPVKKEKEEEKKVSLLPKSLPKEAKKEKPIEKAIEKVVEKPIEKPVEVKPENKFKDIVKNVYMHWREGGYYGGIPHENRDLGDYDSANKVLKKIADEEYDGGGGYTKVKVTVTLKNGDSKTFRIDLDHDKKGSDDTLSEYGKYHFKDEIEKGVGEKEKQNPQIQNPKIDDRGNKFWRNEKGELHREDGPAFEIANGDKFWYLNGKRHRIGGPAVERTNGTKEWGIFGGLHRDNGPAVERADGTKEYWVDGKPHKGDGNGTKVNDKLHREDGPAFEDATGSEEFWINGKRHRIGGPAVERADGTKEEKPTPQNVNVSDKWEEISDTRSHFDRVIVLRNGDIGIRFVAYERGIGKPNDETKMIVDFYSGVNSVGTRSIEKKMKARRVSFFANLTDEYNFKDFLKTNNTQDLETLVNKSVEYLKSKNIDAENSEKLVNKYDIPEFGNIDYTPVDLGHTTISKRYDGIQIVDKNKKIDPEFHRVVQFSKKHWPRIAKHLPELKKLKDASEVEKYLNDKRFGVKSFWYDAWR